MKGYNTVRKTILGILHTQLSDDLYYHGVHHTLDALRSSKVYLKHIQISKHEAKLLRLGILLHDIGFAETTENHEQKGIEIAEKILGQHHFSDQDIQIITGLILATKIPQRPQSLLEQIICDVDLDYLGRSDFYEIGDQLYRELKVYKGMADRNEWNRLQIKFLEAHQYHTEFAIQNRQPQKEQRILELKKMIQ